VLEALGGAFGSPPVESALPWPSWDRPRRRSRPEATRRGHQLPLLYVCRREMLVADGYPAAAPDQYREDRSPEVPVDDDGDLDGEDAYRGARPDGVVLFGGSRG
jgi:hypothetical protein